MVYVWEFEFFHSDGMVDAVPCGSLGGGGTFGSDLNDAVESAADFLACMVDDHLMGGVDLPAPDFGHEPRHGGKIIAVAVSRELNDIPAVTAADAARVLGVSSARVSQLINAGLLDSWKDGTKRMVSKASIEARLADAPKAGAQKRSLLPCKGTPGHIVFTYRPLSSLDSRRTASRIERNRLNPNDSVRSAHACAMNKQSMFAAGLPQFGLHCVPN